MTTKGPDAGLRRELRAHLPSFQWTHIESPTTAPGCPDTEFCAPGGISGWVECKRTYAFAINFRPLQISWIDRRARLGGRVFVAVRRLRTDADELWIYDGKLVKELAERGLRVPPIGMWGGGPSGWNWEQVAGVLT